jgi:hypothetical protein
MTTSTTPTAVSVFENHVDGLSSANRMIDVESVKNAIVPTLRM